ncbi:hypothetical protein [Tuwongella immobilis]|uniref:Secreted protein n=1 Tax=Tuwongella immobilis TaxID=692036 RepID=A0A6C2YUH3_9BACT|nr:hypothetical protein [Tuwongella immobilis]VIP04803.1 Secreted protein OS=Rhodopirellula europaea SH398 GN=RESH_00384 PE=4 SV=1 [Tuwongella immobilis]VTS06966.1 Secreted protein OS=Rhodopirellula europaea SH398 GN=RESH_00384 PE=4 SV=1 [Tuwongella immobilis]
MTSISSRWLATGCLVAFLSWNLGCDSAKPTTAASPPATASKPVAAAQEPAELTPEQEAAQLAKEIAEERAKLSPEDQQLVAAQEWCVISDEERLGSMGPPLKVMVNGEPVFICCKGCQRTALADPAATLKKRAELIAKAKQERATPAK